MIEWLDKNITKTNLSKRDMFRKRFSGKAKQSCTIVPLNVSMFAPAEVLKVAQGTHSDTFSIHT